MTDARDILGVDPKDTNNKPVRFVFLFWGMCFDVIGTLPTVDCLGQNTICALSSILQLKQEEHSAVLSVRNFEISCERLQ